MHIESRIQYWSPASSTTYTPSHTVPLVGSAYAYLASFPCPRPPRSPANIIRAIIFLSTKKIIARIMFAGEREGTRLRVRIHVHAHAQNMYFGPATPLFLTTPRTSEWTMSSSFLFEVIVLFSVGYTTAQSSFISKIYVRDEWSFHNV